MARASTSQVENQPDLPPFVNRLLESWSRFFAPGDIPTVVILVALLLIPPLSLDAADWPLSMSVIIPVTIMSGIFGLIFSRSRFGELLALIISSTYGVCMVLLLTATTLDGPLGTNVYNVFERTIEWLTAAFTGGINPDDLVFTLLVSFLFWFLGYNAAWHTFRIDRVWRVILPPGMILATNVVFSESDANLDGYLVVFLFLSLLLVVRSNLDAREWEWYANGIRIPKGLRWQFVNLGAVLAFIALIIGWAMPTNSLEEQTESFREFMNSNPVQAVTEFWNRLFSPLDATGPTTADYYGSDTLELGGAIRLGDQEVLLVNVPTDRRYYWRSRVFDTYESGLWRSAADTRLRTNTTPFVVNQEITASREPVEQVFTVMLNASRIIYTAPQPNSVDVRTRTDLFYTSPDVDRNVNVSVIRPQQVMRRGDNYLATSLMSTANAFQLRQAGTDYPGWVRDLYLYVSPSITQRTKDLAIQVVTDAQASNPYDQAKAIERYLRLNITYNETIPAPPNGQDPVDWVLFDYQEGYCNYYASAMIMMLRSLGVPSRMAAGFAQGTWDAERNSYVVTERDAHTWVEVYFPGYGWIEFEPTAAQASLDREGDDQQPEPEQQFAPPPPTLTPSPSPTPLATPTPLPTATEPPPADAEQSDGAANQGPTLTPTITPTFTPSPTPTPVIVPTQPAPIPPEASNPFEVILPTLGLLALILFTLFVLFAIALYIYWWWEWRGMGGLSPITRAYARLERYLGLIGLRMRPDETTEERRRRIVQALPQAQRPINAITRMYATERYRRHDDDESPDQRKIDIADRAWTDARSSILQKWSRKFRFWKRGDENA